MDKKISEFPVAVGVTVTTIIPVVVDGINKGLTVGVLALNMPNLGNKGITKNTIIQATGAIIPLTCTVVSLPLSANPYTLPNGSDGQEITIVSLANITVNISSGYSNTVSMNVGSAVTLIFLLSVSKWVVKSFNNCTITNV